jgi:RimJ/RimL family protein N-acetyltransferase
MIMLGTVIRPALVLCAVSFSIYAVPVEARRRFKGHYRVEQATVRDLPAIRCLTRRPHPHLRQRTLASQLRMVKRGEMFVARDRNGAVIGKGNLERDPYRRSCELGGLFVNSRHRRHGVMTSLAQHVLERTVLRSETKAVVTHVLSGNVAAHNLLRKLGFQDVKLNEAHVPLAGIEHMKRDAQGFVRAHSLKLSPRGRLRVRARAGARRPAH